MANHGRLLGWRWILAFSVALGALATALSLGAARHYALDYKVSTPIPVIERGAPAPFMLEIGATRDARALADVRSFIFEQAGFDERSMVGPVQPSWLVFDLLIWSWILGLIMAVAAFAVRKLQVMSPIRRLALGAAGLPLVWLALWQGPDPTLGAIGAVLVLALLTHDGLVGAGTAFVAAAALAVLNPAWNPRSEIELAGAALLFAGAVAAVAWFWPRDARSSSPAS